MRKLKHHEEKLLKKVDLLGVKRSHNLREIEVLRRYHIVDREDYHKYNKIAGMVTKLVAQLKELDAKDPFRITTTEQLLNKLFAMGVVPDRKSLESASKVSVSAIARRRLPVVMVRLRMAQNVQQAATYVEQGHVRVGPQVVTDPAMCVTRSLEDYVTWVDNSAIKRHISTYNAEVDDFDMLQA